MIATSDCSPSVLAITEASPRSTNYARFGEVDGLEEREIVAGHPRKKAIRRTRCLCSHGGTLP